MREGVLLAADGGPEVGLGHVMRVRSVAQALRGLGVEPVLLVADEAGGSRLAAEGFRAVAAARDVLAAGPFHAALLDGFHEWPELAPALRAAGTFLVLMENRTGLRPRADAVVYPGLHHEPDAWDRAHPERVHAGPGWTPLPRELLELAPAPEPDLDLLVSFGGSDPGGLTERALGALAAVPEAARLAVVVGPHMAARREPLAAALARLGRGELVVRPPALGPLVARARAVLTAVGTTLAECAWLGVPALVLANYAADAPALRHYARRGPHVPLGVAGELEDAELARALGEGLRRLAGRPREPLAELGEGAERVARLLARP